MKRLKFLTPHISRTVGYVLIGSLGMLALLVWRLGNLIPDLTPLEQATSTTVYGWNGLLHNPIDLPLAVVRSIVFSLAGHHGALLTRLPNVLFGYIAVLSFAILIKYWHGMRTAFFATLLFATCAWFLHVSRLASSDVLYLMTVPLLLLIQLLMLKRGSRALIYYGNLVVCGMLLYVPGLVWFVLLSLYWQRTGIRAGWQRFSTWWQRGLYVLLGFVWLPLLAYRLTNLSLLQHWLGLPDTFNLVEIGRQLAFVPFHLLVRGPFDPERWLGHAPILDIFTVVMTLVGFYFYVTHPRATRSRLLASYLLLGLVLVGLGGAVTISILVPIMYMLAAMGMAYLLHDWLRVFPVNPVARRLGIGLIAVAVAASCLYNLRAYFVAWPHNPTTLSLFQAKK